MESEPGAGVHRVSCDIGWWTQNRQPGDRLDIVITDRSVSMRREPFKFDGERQRDNSSGVMRASQTLSIHICLCQI